MDSQSTKFLETTTQTGTVKANVIFWEFAVQRKPLDIPGAVDIDDLVAELESLSSENAKALSCGREWVADNFYADRLSVASLRLKKGWSQAELARRAETSQSYIGRLEQGKVDPQISTVRKIAAVLGVSIEILAQALEAEEEA